MKVSLDTVEMTDEQRTQLANVLDGKVSKRKATRAEAKEFVWSYGATWVETLNDMANGEAQDAEEPEPDEDDNLQADEDEDLIGGGSSELDDLL